MSADVSARPRLGFLGVGWIGRHRMHAVAGDGCADVRYVADADPAAAAGAAAEVGAEVIDADELLRRADVDGIVIATPSALHASQSIAALGRGVAVFCQKPLGRDAAEVAAVVDAARTARRPLGVDMSYRHLAAVQPMRRILAEGGIGEVHTIDLVFHNAYGPDKPWFLDRSLSGGGCVIDLGIHLLDLATWLVPAAAPLRVADARRYRRGRRLAPEDTEVEDVAVAMLDTATGGTARLACSWFLHAGRDAVIEVTCHGTEGGLSLTNVGGSFYDFEARHHRGTASELIAAPPDEWGGRAIVSWVRELACASAVRAGDGADGAGDDGADGAGDDEATRLLSTAAVIDEILAR